jgi:hypothetical protein
MEQSKRYGEKPVRLVLCKDHIRTLNSLALTKPVEIKEFWRVESVNILKVSFCPELCVVSILYLRKDEDTGKQHTKVFFINEMMGKRLLQSYKKIKPASVQLSPGRPKPKTTKKFDVVKEESDLNLSTSFRLKMGLQHEKFWRAMILSDIFMVREIFLGLSPVGIRIIDPASLEPETVIEKIRICKITYGQYSGNTVLKVRFLEDKGSIGKTKVKKSLYHVLPVTGQDILRWYDFCSTLGEEAEAVEMISELPSIKPPPEPKQNPKKDLTRGQSELNVRSKRQTHNTDKENVKPKLTKTMSSKENPIVGIRLENF